MPYVKMIKVYADLIDLSPEKLAKPLHLRKLLVKTLVAEIIDLSPEVLAKKLT